LYENMNMQSVDRQIFEWLGCMVGKKWEEEDSKGEQASCTLLTVQKILHMNFYYFTYLYLLQLVSESFRLVDAREISFIALFFC
jgi:hypothetical protein